MKTSGQTTFDTPLGLVTLRWTPQGISELSLLGERAGGRTMTSDRDTMPDWVNTAVEQVRAHLGGKLQDFSATPLDLKQATPFYRDVYDAARRIPPGKTVSYGQLAKTVGRPGAARAVGQALAKNPILLIVPCHRILGGSGAAVGFSAPGGVQTKARMLALEGASVPRVN